MEPKKAKTAILITVIAAVLILAVCLCILFDVPVFGKKEAPEPEKTPIAITPQPTAKPSPKPAQKPSEADLEGTSEMLQHPDPKNYLEDYVPMVTRTDSANVNGRIYMTLYTKPPELEYEIVAKLDGNQKVTLVLLKEGVAGWIKTTELDDYTE